jgi:hypothetical protein
MVSASIALGLLVRQIPQGLSKTKKKKKERNSPCLWKAKKKKKKKGHVHNTLKSKNFPCGPVP